MRLMLLLDMRYLKHKPYLSIYVNIVIACCLGVCFVCMIWSLELGSEHSSLLHYISGANGRYKDPLKARRTLERTLEGPFLCCHRYGLKFCSFIFALTSMPVNDEKISHHTNISLLYWVPKLTAVKSERWCTCAHSGTILGSCLGMLSCLGSTSTGIPLLPNMVTVFKYFNVFRCSYSLVIICAFLLRLLLTPAWGSPNVWP